MRCYVEVFDAAVTGSGPVDAWVSGSGGEGAAIGHFFRDKGGMRLINDRLDVEIARCTAIRRSIEFAIGNIRSHGRLRHRSGSVRAGVEKRGRRRSLRCNGILVSIGTGAEGSFAEVGVGATEKFSHCYAMPAFRMEETYSGKQYGSAASAVLAMRAVMGDVCALRCDV